MSAAVNIQILTMDRIEQSMKIESSIQKEFEEYASLPNYNEAFLQAKKRQLARIQELRAQDEKIHEAAAKLAELVYKLQACLIVFGVSPIEVESFVNRRRQEIELQMDQTAASGVFQVPFKFQPYLNLRRVQRAWVEKLDQDLKKAEAKKPDPVTEPKIAPRPLLGIQGIKDLIEKSK